MINKNFKELLLSDIEKANDIEEIKILLNRLIASIPTNEDVAESIIKALKIQKY